ncbi:hypothetical protein PC116_g20716 [Phytophthora cactorum]|nr:hypothetical protein PC116_g20716 [Phytophthora cactorum]
MTWLSRQRSIRLRADLLSPSSRSYIPSGLTQVPLRDCDPTQADKRGDSHVTAHEQRLGLGKRAGTRCWCATE